MNGVGRCSNFSSRGGAGRTLAANRDYEAELLEPAVAWRMELLLRHRVREELTMDS